MYLSSKALPYKSWRSGTSDVEKRVQYPYSARRFMNKSGIHTAVLRSCARRRSSPVFLRSSIKSSISRCQYSRYAAAAPRLRPERFIEMVTSLAILRNGITPWLSTPVVFMSEPVARTGVQSVPTPPAYLSSWAELAYSLNIACRSSGTVERKHEESWGRRRPAWYSVGEEGV